MKTRLMVTIALGLTALAAAALKPDESEDEPSRERAVAGALHAVITADRTVYTQVVVARLNAKEAIVGMSDYVGGILLRIPLADR